MMEEYLRRRGYISLFAPIHRQEEACKQAGGTTLSDPYPFAALALSTRLLALLSPGDKLIIFCLNQLVRLVHRLLPVYHSLLTNGKSLLVLADERRGGNHAF